MLVNRFSTTSSLANRISISSSTSSTKAMRRTYSPSHIVHEVETKMAKASTDRASWSAFRTMAAKLVESRWFDMSMFLLIALSMVLVIVEVNNGARSVDMAHWQQALNLCILVVYFLETCMKLAVFRWSFLSDVANVVDLAVVAIDIVVTIIVLLVPVGLTPVILARIARLMKVTRAVRMLTMVPELNILVKGLLFASKTVCMGALFLILLACFWGILATLYIQPIADDLGREGYWALLDCKRCSRAFSSVEMSMLTFCQQLIVGEGWSELNTPIIEKRPETAIFFLLVLVSFVLGALNLLLGVIVERAMEAKAASARDVASKKQRDRGEAGKRLFEICKSMDTDKGGTLSVPELREGYAENDDFRSLLHMMDLGDRDLEMVFGILDTDGSGDVEYKEFVDELIKMTEQETHTLLIVIRYYVTQVWARLNQLSLSRCATDKAKMPAHDTACGEEPPSPPPSEQRFPEQVADQAKLAMNGVELSIDMAELEAELLRLSGLRHEMRRFSAMQVDQLDAIQTFLAEALRGLPKHVANMGTPCASDYRDSPCLGPADGSPYAKPRENLAPASEADMSPNSILHRAGLGPEDGPTVAGGESDPQQAPECLAGLALQAPISTVGVTSSPRLPEEPEDSWEWRL